MGVQFDRILDDFDGPFEKLTDFAKVPGRHDQGRPRRPSATTSRTRPTTASSSSTGCWRPGEDVSWLANGPMGRGTFYVAAKPTTPRDSAEGAPTSASRSRRRATAPAGTMSKLKKLRIGLFDHYGGGTCRPAGRG